LAKRFLHTLGRFLPLTTGSIRPRLCKNSFEHDRCSKPD
jgi:hypothetical protein